MKVKSISRSQIHFTNEHEWIDFNGTVAFVGLSAFRLLDIKNISKITWHHKKGSLEKGSVIANVYSDKEIIEVHAPVSCKFLGINQKLANNFKLIIQSPQDQGWLFFITPTKLKEKECLKAPLNYYASNQIKAHEQV
jgi:glycine cleavage system H protein